MDQIAEALILELASSGSREIKLSEEQGTLAIPSQLVYIAGITLSGKSSTPPYNLPTLQERFTKLQELYNSQAAHPLQSFFSLSPRIVPTEEQQGQIDADISQKRKELEMQANAALEELLKTEEKALKVATSKKSKQSRVKQSLPLTQQNKEGNDEDARGRVPSETLGDIMATKLHADNEQAGFNDGSWISVKKKGSKSDPLISIRKDDSYDKENDTTFKSQEDTTIVAHPSEKMANTSTVVPKGEDAANDGSVGPYFLAAAQQGTPTTSTAPLTTISSSSLDGDKKTDRIQQLEAQLGAKQEQLQKDRVMYDFFLREEKERLENIIQDLQLRLMISETRLKTYQDALEHHVESVTSNLSNNYAPSSPIRQRRRGHPAEQNPPSSPLISRVLIQQNRLEM